jgi:hypothetical protein
MCRILRIAVGAVHRISKLNLIWEENFLLKLTAIATINMSASNLGG